MTLGLERGAPLWTAALALAAAAAVVWHLRRSRASAALRLLRAAAAFAVLAALLDPVLALRRPLLEKPRLLILVDRSHSMGGKAGGGRTRLQAAARWLLRRRSRLQRRSDVELFAVDGGAKRLADWEELSSLKSADEALDAASALRQAADSLARQPARVWLLSDGNAEDSSPLEAELQRLGVALDVLGVGPKRREKGVEISRLKIPDFVFLHSRFRLEVELDASGLAGEPVRLSLLRQEDGAWRPVDSKTLRASGAEETLSASFSDLARRLGRRRYRLRVEAGGLTRPRDFSVEVVREKYRIMYLAGRPSAEYAQLRALLKSDPNRELVSFVILRNPDAPSIAPDDELSLIPFPADEIFVRKLGQFDLFILEDFSATRFNLPRSYMESLRRFVAAGGGLLVIGGSTFAEGGYQGGPLEDLLPVALSSASPGYVPGLFHAQVTAPSNPLASLYDTPQACAAAWRALPPLDGVTRFGAVRAGSTVLAVDPEQRADDGRPLPVLAIRDYGRGKVMLLGSDSTWRWKLGAASDWRIGDFYARFWTRAIRYLSGSLDLSKVRFDPLPDRLPAREPARLFLRVFDDDFRPADAAAVTLRAVWTGPDGRSRELSARQAGAGLYEFELTGLSAGPQRVRAEVFYDGRPWGGDTARFQWLAAPAEAPMNWHWIEEAARAGGGRAVELKTADVGRLLSLLPGPRARARILRRLRPASSLAWLAAALALLLAEWILRRLRGLP
ncbi:MAG: hypothetical protein KGO96_06660 [Elusimicrobia bacterium]|nr:hypothetical protein [Elusimicrobiota bacterium]MDE2425572.1 hypothetical protein [Elusimicrobiota bacterium]